jgi:hypothetical protein
MCHCLCLKYPAVIVDECNRVLGRAYRLPLRLVFGRAVYRAKLGIPAVEHEPVALCHRRFRRIAFTHVLNKLAIFQVAAVEVELYAVHRHCRARVVRVDGF